MRSVLAHLIGVTREAVAARLYEIACRTDHVWLFPPAKAEQAVYLNFYDDLMIECELEDRDILKSALGTLPDVSVIADISGRIPGDAEVREILSLLLRSFKGVAWDEYTSHCWTLEEIEADAEVHGHRFFDYTGWHAEYKAQCDQSAAKRVGEEGS